MLEDPTTPEKIYAAAENQHLQLWTLVADAIASAHIRTVGSAATREDRGRESAIPFLYAFLDYMRLALPDLPDVVLAAGDTSRGLSTETGGEVEVYQGSGATPQCQIGSTRILIDDQPGRDAAHGRMLRRFLDTVCERAAANSPGASETLEETMARGLADILTSPSGSGDEDEGEAPSTRDGSEAADSILDEIVGETHEHLARALRSADLPCALVTRCWTGGDASYRLLRYVATGSGRVTPDGMPLQLEEEPERAGWKLIVGQAFRTGLLQLGRISQDGSPCAFHATSGACPGSLCASRLASMTRGCSRPTSPTGIPFPDSMTQCVLLRGVASSKRCGGSSSRQLGIALETQPISATSWGGFGPHSRAFFPFLHRTSMRFARAVKPGSPRSPSAHEPGALDSPNLTTRSFRGLCL